MNRTRVRVSYVIRDDVEPSHRFGINALAYDAQQGVLFSAGRDSIVRKWATGRGTEGGKVYPSYKGSFEQHTDWVNDIQLGSFATGGDHLLLLSASSDTTVKMWNLLDGSCLSTLTNHNDYVKALACGRRSARFVSAGLDRMVYMYDVETLAKKGGVDVARFKGHKDSVYCVDCDDPCRVLVSGSSEKLSLLWDTRSDSPKIGELRGHADTVKAVRLSPDGSKCLSGSSDGTIKLWDVGERRCVVTYDIHDDSVWGLWTNDDFTAFYSGGRDGRVFRTVLKTSEATLLVKEEKPILSVSVDEDNSSMWVSTTRCNIKYWDFKDINKHDMGMLHVEEKNSTPQSPQRRFSRLADVRTGSPVASPMMDQIPEIQALCQTPAREIRGKPGIVEYRILNTKREVLTRDSDDCVDLWDIVRGKKMHSYGKNVNIDDVEKELHVMSFSPNWFSVDTKIGLLTIHLDQSQCFSVERYAGDITGPQIRLKMDVDNAPEDDRMYFYNGEIVPDDTKLNMGTLCLKALFRNWMDLCFDEEGGSGEDGEGSNANEKMSAAEMLKVKRRRASSLVTLGNRPSGNSLLKGPGGSVIPNSNLPSHNKERGSSFNSQQSGSRNGSMSGVAGATNDEGGKNNLRTLRPYFQLPDHTPVIFSDESKGQPLTICRILCRDMCTDEGCDLLETHCPQWVHDCIFKDDYKYTPIKYSFILEPIKQKDGGEPLPALPQGNRLSAHRIIQVDRIIRYIVDRIQIVLPDREEGVVGQPKDYLEILCSDEVLDLNIDMGTVRQFKWKQPGEEVRLEYRWINPSEKLVIRRTSN
eukprot:Nk52_evm12s2367 gene=Nk52_evmTU12s2367